MPTLGDREEGGAAPDPGGEAIDPDEHRTLTRFADAAAAADAAQQKAHRVAKQRRVDPYTAFHNLRALRSSFRRLEFLATLGLPITSRSVLEIGAGIGDLTSFFLDRECTVTSTEPRDENITYFRTRYEDASLWPAERLRIVQSDVSRLHDRGVGVHDIVFCFGTMNELDDPEGALRIFAEHCSELLILEIAVTSGPGLHNEAIRFGNVDHTDLRASISGRASVPTRRWVFNRLLAHFAHVYMTRMQPAFDRYRVDWREPAGENAKDRVLFIASRSPLENELLVEGIPDVQPRLF